MFFFNIQLAVKVLADFDTPKFVISTAHFKVLHSSICYDYTFTCCFCFVFVFVFSFLFVAEYSLLLSCRPDGRLPTEVSAFPLLLRPLLWLLLWLLLLLCIRYGHNLDYSNFWCGYYDYFDYKSGQHTTSNSLPQMRPLLWLVWVPQIPLDTFHNRPSLMSYVSPFFQIL